MKLTLPTAPNSDWNAIALQPDPLLEDDGFFDAQALVASPSTAGTFSVVFDWLGVGDPGAQPFAIYDAGFNTVEQGMTLPIPEPSTALLLAVGLLGLGNRMRGRGAP